MKKLLLSICLSGLIAFTANAQNNDLADQYMEFKIARSTNSQTELTKTKATELLKHASELNTTQVASLNLAIGRAWETEGRITAAVPYYEAVIKLVPGYYVPYRALAYYNLKKCDTLGKAISESVRLKDPAMNKAALQAYTTQAKKTIAYFEKALACDTDDDTSRDILASLYKSIKEPDLMTTLPTRLKALSADCITLLDD